MPNDRTPSPEYKSVKAVLDDSAEGTISAVVSTFDTVDSDGDVVLPSFWKQGEALPMVWAHQWDRPIGRGTIDVHDDKAVFNGRLFLDTTAGKEAHATMKQMADLQEFSFGYRVTDAEFGQKDGQSVRFLKAGERFEVSPVLVGANRATSLLSLKSGDHDQKRAWDAAYVSNLPDSAFAVILPGGKKDDEGKTTPRSLRKLPHHNADGSLDMPHLRNALSRLPQSSLPGNAKSTAEAHLEKHATAQQVGDRGKSMNLPMGFEYPEGSYEDLAEDIAEAFEASQWCDEGDEVTTVATFPGGIAYVCVCEPYAMMDDDGPAYYRVQYDLDPDGDPVITGADPVEASIAFAPMESQQPGISYAGQTERALAALRGLVARAKAHAATRTKEGRTLSAANVTRLQNILQALRDAADEMDGLIGDAAPPPKEPPKADHRGAIQRDWLVTQARLMALLQQEITA